MSKAFTRETDGDDEDDLPDEIVGLPAGAKNYMTPQGFERMREELQTLMRKVDNDTLCKALKGADERVRGFFLGNMSTRAAKNITDEMGSLGPIRLKDVDEAQAKMTELAKELAEKGEIMIAKSSGEEELVY